MYKARRPALNRKAPRHNSCRDGQSVSFRKVGKQIPGVAEFDFPKRQTPRHPIQIPISVPRTRHTRITAIWLGHARPLFQLRNPRLSHWWSLHSWKSLLEKSVQWCRTGHILSILANWKVVFATRLEALHKVQLCCMHFVSLKMCLLFTPSTSIISQNVTQKQLSQSSCNSTLIQTSSRDSLDQFQRCVGSSNLNVQHPFVHELHMSCFIKRHHSNHIKSYQIIIYRNHAVGPKESGKSCRAVKPAAFSSSCVKSLRSDPCTSAKAASMSRLGWPAAMSSSSEKPGTKETSKGYKDEQRWRRCQIQRIVVWFNSFLRSVNPQHGVTLLLFSISIVFYSFHSISRLRISCDACTHQLQCREDLKLFSGEAQPSKLTGRNTSWRDALDAFDALQSEILFQTIQKSWENGSIHCRLMWAPRKDSWIFRSLRDWLSFLYDLTAIAVFQKCVSRCFNRLPGYPPLFQYPRCRFVSALRQS